MTTDRRLRSGKIAADDADGVHAVSIASASVVDA
jgi:hypothetical protein